MTFAVTDKGNKRTILRSESMTRCNFCEKFDFATAKTEVTKYGANILLALCNTKFLKEEQFNFCPVCGKDLRKEEE